MPLHMVQDDLAAGRVVKIELEASPNAPPGPAGRRFIALLKEG